MRSKRVPAADGEASDQANPVRRGATAPSSFDAPSPRGPAARRCCGRLCILLLPLLLFCISVAALALAARVYRPDVLISSSPRGPEGYIFGGSLSQGSGYWVPRAAYLPDNRSDLGVIALGASSSGILLLGGVGSASGEPVATVWEFNAVTERVNTSRAPLPEARYRFGVALLESGSGALRSTRVIVVGGLKSSSGVPTAADGAADCRSYDVPTDSWSACAPLSVPRVDLFAAALEGVVYAVGGYTGEGYSPSGALEAYDGVSWRRLADMPTPRGDLVAACLSGRLWVMGGWSDVPAPLGAFSAVVEAFSPASGGWARAANLLVARGDLGAAVYRGSLFAFGGEMWSGRTAPCAYDAAQTCAVNQVPTHDTSSFLPDLEPARVASVLGPAGAGDAPAGVINAPGVWSALAPMPGDRFRFNAAAHDVAQAIFVFGGARENGELINTVAAFYDVVHPQAFVHYRDANPLTLRSWF